MINFNKRWYEKDEFLKSFMSLLEDLHPDLQCEIAVDIIIKASTVSGVDYEKMITEVGDYNPAEYKRWYDKNPNIHVAIECLKDLDENQKEEIIQEVIDRILEHNNIDTLGETFE